MFEEDNGDKEDVKLLAVYQKATEIVDLVVKIAEVIEDELNNQSKSTENEIALQLLSDMLGNAYILPVKISGAHGVDLYDLKMENAALIRKAARELSTNCIGLEIFGVKKSLAYLQILRDEIDLFRVEFAEWVNTFNAWDYIIDRWGLFNPPGVNYDDHDPDDGIPFNPDDLNGLG